MKRVAIGAVVVVALFATIVATPVTAGADRFAKIRWGANSVTLTVPTPPPACRTTHGTISCRWALLVTEDGTNTTVGAAIGTSGVLTVAYPTTCGVIRASALVGPPVRREVGYAHTISDHCTAPPPVAPAAVAATDAADSVNGVAAPLLQPASPLVQSAAASTHSTGPSALPFTGAPIVDFLEVGAACLLLSAGCLLPLRRRRYVGYRRPL